MSQPVHSVLSPHRQRMALIIASIVAQFALYVVVLVQFTQYFVYFYWICVGVSLAVSLLHLRPAPLRWPIRSPGSSPSSWCPSSAG